MAVDVVHRDCQRHRHSAVAQTPRRPNLLAKYYAPLNVTSDVAPAAAARFSICPMPSPISRSSTWRSRWRCSAWPSAAPLLVGLAAIYTLGVLAAAEFASAIGLLVAFAVILILTKSGRIVLYAVPLALLGAVLLWPVIEIRLSGFQGGQLPYSWVLRLQNLQGYFWPTLFSDWNWILGVRPDARAVRAEPVVRLCMDRKRLYVAALGWRDSSA